MCKWIYLTILMLFAANSLWAAQTEKGKIEPVCDFRLSIFFDLAKIHNYDDMERWQKMGLKQTQPLRQQLLVMLTSAGYKYCDGVQMNLMPVAAVPIGGTVGIAVICNGNMFTLRRNGSVDLEMIAGGEALASLRQQILEGQKPFRKELKTAVDKILPNSFSQEILTVEDRASHPKEEPGNVSIYASDGRGNSKAFEVSIDKKGYASLWYNPKGREKFLHQHINVCDHKITQ